MKKFKPILPILGLAAFLLFTACAEQRPDRNYVQPNATPKSMFTGEWYYRWTVVEVPYTSAMAFEGYQGELERIKWEITESHLIAYRSYDFIPGSQPEGNPESERDTAPIAAFPILSHFDIQRDYNATTGEEYNLFEENTVDRPWNEREYMRVDWKSNSVDYGIFLYYSPAADSQDGVADVTDWIDETQVDNPEHPLFTPDYFHFVVRGWFKPMLYEVYDCLFAFESVGCGPAELKIRHSFKKVPNSDYIPESYPDYKLLTYKTIDDDGNVIEKPFYDRYDPSLLTYRPCDLAADGVGECQPIYDPIFSRFGYFRTERPVYDRQRDLTETAKIYYANRWNIWKNNLDAEGNPIDYSLRDINPIVYYANVGTPQYAFEMGLELAEEWNKAFQETTTFLSGRNRPEAVFVYKENSCSVENVNAYLKKHPEYKPEVEKYVKAIKAETITNACAVLEYVSLAGSDPFTWQQLGDLRFSFINWVDTPQLAGPLGYGPSSADPLTGEIINGVANIYGASVETYAAYATDVVRAINGDLSMPDIATGENVWRYINKNREQSLKLLSATPSEAFMNKMEERFAKAGADAETVNKEKLKGYNSNEGFERLKRIKGTKLERELLINDDILQAFAGTDWRPGDPVSDELIEKASPANWGAGQLHDRYQKKAKELMNHKTGCIYHAEFADDAILGLALELKGKPYDEIYQTLLRAIYKGVTLHEIGHTVGLRHNFEASYDSLNYFDEYWKLKRIKTDGLKQLMQSAEYNAMSVEEKRKAETEFKMQALDEMLKKNLREYQYSSIMEYGAKFNSDIHGLGRYDIAAIKFGYGKVVEAFDDRVAVPSNAEWNNLQFIYDYENIPQYLNFNSQELKNFCGEPLSEGLSDQEISDYITPYVSTVSGNKPTLSDLHKYDLIKMRKNIFYDDYLAELREMYQVRLEAWLAQKKGTYHTYRCDTGATKDITFSVADKWVYQTRNRLVPYRFCSDEFNGSYPQCRTWDEGASTLEIVSDAINQYQNYYFFNNFKRDRLTWAISGVDSYMNRIFSRYFVPMANIFQFMYLYRFYVFGGLADKDIRQAYQFYADLSKGACEAANLFATVLAAPYPGRHCYYSSEYIYYPDYFFSNPDSICNQDPAHPSLFIPVGEGRYYSNDWTDHYLYKIKRIGSLYDKILALQAITYTSSPFERIDPMSDIGFFNINFYRIFKPELLRFFHGLVSERYDLSGGRIKNGEYHPKILCDYNVEETGEYFAEEDKDASLIFPATSYTINYYALLYGLAFMTSTQDRTLDFSKYLRISIKGAPDDYDWSGIPSENLIEFTEPTSGLTYRAAQTADGLSIGYALVKEVKDYYEKYWLPDKLAYDTALSDLNAVLSENLDGVSNDGRSYAKTTCGVDIGTGTGGGDVDVCIDYGLECANIEGGNFCAQNDKVPQETPDCNIYDECAEGRMPVHIQDAYGLPRCICLIPCEIVSGDDDDSGDDIVLSEADLIKLTDCFRTRSEKEENDMFIREMYFQRRVERLDIVRLFWTMFEYGTDY
ncbi:MAG: hypothetical protein Kow0090_18870 [Myxococcota bacterium]